MAISAAPAANGNRTPLSVDDLIRKKKEDEAAQSKPKFLSKAQREALALERRQAEAEKKRAATEAQLTKNREQQRDGSTDSPHREERRHDNVPTGPKALRYDGHDGRDRDHRGGRDSRDGRGGRNQRDSRHPREDRDQPTPPAPPEPTTEDTDLPIINRELLQSRYLGAQSKDKRKIRKMSDKKFVFEWDKTEDTGGSETDPLYRALLDGPKETKFERPRVRQDDMDV
jgi:ATP-dependent RNA helicase DDX23/PRP28